jgi:hypothetical protein
MESNVKTEVESGGELYKAWTGWNWKDIQMMRPDWSVDDCWKFIEDNEDIIVEVMVDAGWFVINDILGEEPE